MDTIMTRAEEIREWEIANHRPVEDIQFHETHPPKRPSLSVEEILERNGVGKKERHWSHLFREVLP